MFNRRFFFVAATVAALAGCASHSTPVSVADTIAATPWRPFSDAPAWISAVFASVSTPNAEAAPTSRKA